MRRPEHGTPTIDAVVDNEEIVVSRESMFVNAVKAALKRCGAKTIAGRDKTRILYQVSDLTSDFIA